MADSVKVKQTLSWGSTYWRGNRFYGHLDIENTSNGNINTGNNPADSCFDGLTMTGKRIRFGYQHQGSYVLGDIVMNATGPSGTSMSVSSGGFGPEVFVDGNIIINKSGTGACGFASVAGSSHLTMTSGHSIIEGTSGFTEGEIIIKGLTQLGTGGGIYLNSGADAQVLTIAPVDSIPKIGILNIDLDEVSIDGAVVKGTARVIANEIAITDNIFYAPAIIEHTGTVSSYNGGNKFHQSTTLTKSTSTGNFLWGRTAVDTVMSSLQLNILNGGNLVMGFYHDVVLMGSLYCNDQSGNIILGDQWGGGFKIAGAGTQQLKLELGNSILSRNVEIDKPSGRLLLYDLMDVDQHLTFTNGVLETMNDGLVSLRDNALVHDASDASFVQGPVKKIGNDAFTFPVGRNGIYQPLSMSAPSGSTYAFQAEYFDEDSDPLYDHSSKHASINYLDRTQYWTFDKLSGTTGVYITLGWRDVDCGIASINDPDICSWSGTQWNNMGNDSPTGTTAAGTATTPKTTSDYGAYTWGNFSGISSQAGPDRVMEAGDTVTIGIMQQPAWIYDWTPSGTVEESDSAITRAYPTTKTEYVLTAKGENGCKARDTMMVFITKMPEDTARSSLDFVVNNGQIIDTDGAPREDIGIYSHQASPMVYCGDNRVSFVHSKIDTLAATPDTLARVDINFHETFRNAEPLGMGLNPHHYNYYYAHCPEGVTLTPSYNRVVYPQLYENTDLHIKGNNNWMKFEFVMHPGGDPEDILMTFEGADNVQVIQQLGMLVVSSSIGTYVFPKPRVLKVDTVGAAVELGWQPDWDLSVTGDTVRFTNIGAYDPAEVLIFTLGEEPFAVGAADLGNLVWSTYFGGNRIDGVSDICTGADGNLYITGGTSSTTDFPLEQGTYTHHSTSSSVAFIGKIQPFGTRKWVTYYGAGYTGSAAIVTGGVRDVYVTGTFTNDNVSQGDPLWFPIVDPGGGAYVHDIQYGDGPYSYATLIKLNQINGVAGWATFFGDDSDDPEQICVGKDLAINQNGDIFVVGKARKSDNFPIYKAPSLTNAYQLGTTDETLGFIASFNSQDKLMWSTLFGSDNTDIQGVCIGGESEDIFITGSLQDTDYENFETAAQVGTDQEIQSWGGGPGEAFVAQFDGVTYDLLWSTFLGGGGWEIGHALVYNPMNNSLYVCGQTTSGGGSPFPIVDNLNANSINNATFNWHQDGFITRYVFDGDMDWSTYFGGGSTDMCHDIAVGQFGNVFFTGFTEGNGYQDQQMTGGYYQEFLENISGGGQDGDAFIVGLNTDDDLIWSTFFGGENSIGLDGSSEDYVSAIVVSGNNLFIGGSTYSDSDFPLQVDLINYPSAYYQPSNNNSQLAYYPDGFLAQFVLTGTPLPVEEVNSEDDTVVSVFPNPTNGRLNVLTNGMKGAIELGLYDAIGQKVVTKQFIVTSTGQRLTLDLSQLPKGMYILTCLSDEKPIQSTKVIVN